MKPSSELSIKNKKKDFFNMDNLLLNKENPIKNIKNEEKEEKLNSSYKENIKDSNKTKDEKKNKSENINENKNNNGNQKNNFFIDYNSNLKCSCYKVQCNNNYCECLKTGRYCINCYCKNCLNRPPINSTNNIKINYNLTNNAKKKVICTCSKSECKLKYCECFKLGIECTNLCKCIKCKNLKKKNNLLNICFVNSICIDNKELVINNEEKTKKKKTFINLKRNKSKKKIKTEKKGKKKNSIINKDNLNRSLFDENGNLILNHVKLNETD